MTFDITKEMVLKVENKCYYTLDGIKREINCVYTTTTNDAISRIVFNDPCPASSSINCTSSSKVSNFLYF